MTGARRKRIVEMSALAVVVVGLSMYGAFAVVRHYDLTNPYRDGTTRTATLTYRPGPAAPITAQGRMIDLSGGKADHGLLGGPLENCSVNMTP